MDTKRSKPGTDTRPNRTVQTMHSANDALGGMHMKNIHRPKVAKHPARVTGEPFNPAKVSTTLNVDAAVVVLAEHDHTQRLLNPSTRR